MLNLISALIGRLKCRRGHARLDELEIYHEQREVQTAEAPGVSITLTVISARGKFRCSRCGQVIVANAHRILPGAAVA